MKKFILIMVLATGLFNSGYGQGTGTATSVDGVPGSQNLKVYSKVDVAAAFPGGDAAWRSHLQLKLNNNVAKTNGAVTGTYTVIIRFVVDMNGVLSDFTAETHLGYGMETEAISFLQDNPRWIPAQLRGRKVRSYVHQPITFKVP